LLAKLAVEDEDFLTRWNAVDKLTDQAMLAKIANETKDERGREMAVEKIADQALLAQIAVENEKFEVRRRAVGKLADQALLANIAVGDELDVVRRQAVGKLTDQALLAKVAVEAKDSDVRLDAVKKLTDQALLVKIAIENRNTTISLEAVDRISRLIPWSVSQSGLCKIVLETNDEEIRTAALAELSNDRALVQVAFESDDDAVCKMALCKLKPKDVAVIKKITLEHKSPSVRSAAVEMLADPWFNPEQAEMVSDQLLLGQIAVSGHSDSVCEAALRAVTNQDVLATIVIASKEPRIYGAAIRKLQDKDAIARTVVATVEWDDSAAYHRVKICDKVEYLRTSPHWQYAEQSAFARVAISSRSFYNILESLKHITDKVLLAKIVVELSENNTDAAFKEAVKKFDSACNAVFASPVSIDRNEQEKYANYVINFREPKPAIYQAASNFSQYADAGRFPEAPEPMRLPTYKITGICVDYLVNDFDLLERIIAEAYENEIRKIARQKLLDARRT
jgi:hypothetical protein